MTFTSKEKTEKSGEPEHITLEEMIKKKAVPHYDRPGALFEIIHRENGLNFTNYGSIWKNCRENNGKIDNESYKNYIELRQFAAMFEYMVYRLPSVGEAIIE